MQIHVFLHLAITYPVSIQLPASVDLVVKAFLSEGTFSQGEHLWDQFMLKLVGILSSGFPIKVTAAMKVLT